MADYKREVKVGIVVVLDNVRSMHNIGSVFRTCDALKVEKLVLCGITATPPHREIQKTALDATKSVTWKYYEQTEDAIGELKRLGYEIVGVEQTDSSVNLMDYKPEKSRKYALVFGNEVDGVDEGVLGLCDRLVEIPQWGTKHSLNIAVSAGIVLWDMVWKLEKG
ncbi:MAG: RNA methyltransferase [Bacteroidota bacterium]